jgi:hypothetical protein
MRRCVSGVAGTLAKVAKMVAESLNLANYIDVITV